MTTYTVKVSHIAPTTTKDHLSDFFTFCGKIDSIDLDETTQTALVHFEKPSAAKTALMLNGGTLDGANLTVTSDTEHTDEAKEALREGHPIEQTDKPRAAIAAEYLAKGYVLSDSILKRAIDLDQKQGISTRFLSYWNTIDHTVGSKIPGATPDGTLSGTVSAQVSTGLQRAKTLDEQKGFSSKAHEYYLKALQSPFGQKVRVFYTTTSKQVLDIHEEARRIAETQKGSGSASPTSAAAPATGAPEVPPTVTVV